MAKMLLIAAGVVVAVGVVLYSTVYAAPPSAPDLTGKHVAVLTTEGFHDRETSVPIEYVLRGGGSVTLIGPETGEFTAYNSDETVVIEKTVSEVTVDEFDALIIPGGRAPAALREYGEVLEFVRAYMDTGKPIAAICHGPQVLVTAGVIEGRTLTAYSSVGEEIIEAGGEYKEGNLAVPLAVVDGNLITSRLPHDLRPFCERLGEALTK
jgi:protease I